MLYHASGTSGAVAPEVQAWHGPVKTFIPFGKTPPYESFKGRPRSTQRRPKVSKVPYGPFSADVWAVGHVFKCMANVVASAVNQRALEQLGEEIMQVRPSSKRAGDGGVSELEKMVKARDFAEDLDGWTFAVGPIRDNGRRRLRPGPLSPFS